MCCSLSLLIRKMLLQGDKEDIKNFFIGALTVIFLQ